VPKKIAVPVHGDLRHDPGMAENENAIVAWDGVLFDKFTRFRPFVTDGLSVHGAAAIERCEVEGLRVLDLGCGFGDTTLELARRGAREVVGVDAAPRFVTSARDAAERSGLGHVRFEIADVQQSPLGGPYDLAFSRFGTMFFASPVAALRNVRRSLAPGAALCMVVWRRREDNPCFYLAQQVADAMLPLPENDDEPTCGPGPFSMASADLVSEQLRIAGFQRSAFERHDAPIRLGHSVDDAVQFALALGPAGERMRLAKEEGERKRPELEAALREAFAPFLGEQGVMLDSSTWIVRARAG
jgi:SAM-dependent methyltransferase